MKIKIGPYKNWFGPYQLAELLCFWARDVPDEIGIMHKPEWVHKFGEFLAHGSIEPDSKKHEIRRWKEERPETLLYKFLMWVDSKRKRTVKIHIDKYDTWNMESTLAMIILPMLKQLKETSHGAPCVEDTDVPEGINLRSTEAKPKEYDHDIDDNHFKRWNYVLDEMIWTFTQLQPDYDWEQQYCSGESDIMWVPSEEKNKLGNPVSYLMKNGPDDTFKIDFKGREKHEDRIKNGLRLFGKYYRNLWD